MKLQTKFILAIAGIFGILAVCMALTSVLWVDRIAIREAENRVQVYIRSSWEIYNAEIAKVHSACEILAQKQIVRDSLKTPDDTALVQSTRENLAAIRDQQRVDILTLYTKDGRVLFRTRAPFASGDQPADDPCVRRVLATGGSASGTMLLKQARLDVEGPDLTARCVAFGGTPDGMAIVAAVPVLVDGALAGIIEMASLLNGAELEVDTIRDAIFQNEQYRGKPLGTATIFMGDRRISTNVRKADGQRAVGTSAAPNVADQVLRQGRSWTGRAWVVDRWYLSQYDPILDLRGKIIGMLYVGELEQKYLDIRTRALLLFLSVLCAGMVLAVLVFVRISRSILGPVAELSVATERLSNGDLGHRVQVTAADEVGQLAARFNDMARRLEEQRHEIERDQAALKALNEELKTLNRNYMEMLEFVTHEMKNPLASATMSLYTVKDGYLGPLNDRQKKSLESVAGSINYFGEMIRHYLDLARLEKGELTVRRRWLFLCADVLTPVLEGLERAAQDKEMPIENRVPPDLSLGADRDLLRVVYDNLVANAIKYGRKGGRIVLDVSSGSGQLTFSVWNEGAGIAPDKLDLLFRKFSRLDNPEYAGKRGTGLGLYICREIVEKHGGRIWVESDEGTWVRFLFTLAEE